MILISDKVKLRPWSLNDAQDLTSIANNKKIHDGLRDGFPHPYSLKDAEKWLKFAMELNKEQTQYFAIEYDGELAGSIGVVLKEDVYRKSAEIGYFIGEPFWNKGIVTGAIRLISDYIFDVFDRIRIYAEPYASNMASRRALEKAGYHCEAVLKNNVIKNGKIQDSCIYVIFAKDFDIER